MARTTTLIIGGARSGKSSFAEGIALELSSSWGVTYIATADSHDPEMAYRIERHKSRRPQEWTTWEKDITTLPEVTASMRGVLLLDCLTMYITRLFLASPASQGEDELEWAAEEKKIINSVELLFLHAPTELSEPPLPVELLSNADSDPWSHLIVVTNEVGFGVVPSYQMGRRFRDMQGRVNQVAASHADNVALVVAGLPLWIKGGV